jgi:hypothetical protein
MSRSVSQAIRKERPLPPPPKPPARPPSPTGIRAPGSDTGPHGMVCRTPGGSTLSRRRVPRS